MSWGGSNWIHTWWNTTTSVFWNIVNLTYAWPHVTSTRTEITKKSKKNRLFGPKRGPGVNLTKTNFHQKKRLGLNYHLMEKSHAYQGKSHAYRAKNHIFWPFWSETGSRGQFDRKFFSQKDAPGPKLSFNEKKVTRTREKVTRTGPKTEKLPNFRAIWAKKGSRGQFDQKIFFIKRCAWV